MGAEGAFAEGEEEELEGGEPGDEEGGDAGGEDGGELEGEGGEEGEDGEEREEPELPGREAGGDEVAVAHAGEDREPHVDEVSCFLIHFPLSLSLSPLKNMVRLLDRYLSMGDSVGKSALDFASFHWAPKVPAT